MITYPGRLPAYVVTSPVVVARTISGSEIYVYEGGQLPPSVPEMELRRLADIGLIRKASA